MEARQLNTASVLPLPHKQAHPPLRSPGRSAYRLGSHDVVTQVVMAVCLVWNLCLRHQHQVVVTKMHGPGGLGEAEVSAVPDVVCSEVNPWGAGQPAPQRLWHRMESVAAMA